MTIDEWMSRLQIAHRLVGKGYCDLKSPSLEPAVVVYGLRPMPIGPTSGSVHPFLQLQLDWIR